MEHIPTILPLIQRNAIMTSINLQDAYFSVPSVKCHRKYLKFYMGKHPKRTSMPMLWIKLSSILCHQGHEASFLTIAS